MLKTSRRISRLPDASLGSGLNSVSGNLMAERKEISRSMPRDISTGKRGTVLDMIRRLGLKPCPADDLSIAMSRLKRRALDLETDENLPDEMLAEAFALAIEAVSRHLGIQATDEQLLAGLCLLRGTIVQMNAGEGKTIAAAFPAVVHAIGGSSVHVITANDYLAARDAQLLEPVYRALGISVGAVLGYMDDGERRHTYRNEIVYSTMRELGFDFLRDNLKFTTDAKVQGKLEIAIIDEADHALIDEAFTPMIISGRPISDKRAIARVKNAVVEMIGSQRQVAQVLAGQLSRPGLEACDVTRILTQLLLAEPENPTLKEYLADHPGWAKGLRNVAGRDYADFTAELFYAIDLDHRFVSLAEKGRDFLEQRLGPFYDGRALEDSLDSIWAGADGTLEERRKKSDGINRRLARQYNLGNQIYQTLRAFLMLHRDVDYFVTEDSVVLIDKSTGRARLDCIYQQGLQTALEAKEGVASHPDYETLAQISVEGFIQSYRTVSGMTGTASSSSREFLQKYGFPVAVVPPTQPLNRVDLGYKVYLNRRDKLAAIIDLVIDRHKVGQPVLVGTPTVERSEEISRLLSEHGIRHNLLNALSCDLEAETIKDAGRSGAVTVATNMAGRGTDILLDPGLDSAIAERHVELIARILSQEAGSVLIDCHSPQEAGILRTALANSMCFTTNLEEQGGFWRLVVTLKGHVKGHECPADGLVILDFSLGLHVIGTEIYDTPRTGLQLNGRSGRQGDFGLTQTILSLEDNLIDLHVDGVLKLGNRRKVDGAGRTYFSGPEVTAHIEGIQRIAEREGEVQRGLIQDYAAVLDLQTSMFYRWRRQVMEAASQSGFCVTSAEDTAERLVASHFPELTSEGYRVQFDSLMDEVQLDYHTSCSELFGGDFNLLPRELGLLFASKIERMEGRLGPKGFSDLARTILLQTADDLWCGHINELQDCISNEMLATTAHRSAVAHYVEQSFLAWDGFHERIIAQFLSRLLTFPIKPADARPLQTFQLDDDIRALIADRPTAAAAAADQQRR